MNGKQDELIRRAKNDDGDAFSELFQQYTPIVSNFFHHYYVRGFDWEDWVQEANIVLHLAIQDYNEFFGIHFSAYYKILLKRHLFSLIRRDNAKKRRSNQELLSIHSLYENDKVRRLMSDSVDLDAIDQVIINETIKNMIEKLDKFDQEIFCAYLQGNTLKQISGKYDCSIYKATQILKKIKTRMITLLRDS
ncbi:DNA-directed RNA polymerase specialized sigma subunit [Vagococcus lutrae]|uniref:sigma-70 family RNA polymerase sigma factor n=1 Tax=Vagococcus lutrae TaxID=81947 RepID=UPI00192892DF|nr:sigma-70 family RNA polymerase sigma factor [Vagococcus lutrae]MDO5742306.1 sigma-70 family RNA polymerase sigma factor [Vagococcus sp.]GEQ61081.1 DNA-directed RNA polymerase specialized sigma subunit [Vagococcus lutrae]GEQ62986.1 DNA-directed RNA polymerase specialized sigma subunit [Vagococcus lutrae]GEQ64875.1 DNA-directed RNA polymerase specialized sigma subunit [Vagococcus lutrae]